MGGITIAELAGELDIASAPALREKLLSLLCPGSSRLFIDLSKVRLGVASVRRRLVFLGAALSGAVKAALAGTGGLLGVFLIRS